MTSLALKWLLATWCLSIIGFGLWIGWQVLLSALGERRRGRSRRSRRQDVAAVDEAYARWQWTAGRR